MELLTYHKQCLLSTKHERVALENLRLGAWICLAVCVAIIRYGLPEWSVSTILDGDVAWKRSTPAKFATGILGTQVGVSQNNRTTKISRQTHNKGTMEYTSRRVGWYLNEIRGWPGRTLNVNGCDWSSSPRYQLFKLRLKEMIWCRLNGRFPRAGFPTALVIHAR